VTLTRELADSVNIFRKSWRKASYTCAKVNFTVTFWSTVKTVTFHVKIQTAICLIQVEAKVQVQYLVQTAGTKTKNGGKAKNMDTDYIYRTNLNESTIKKDWNPPKQANKIKFHRQKYLKMNWDVTSSNLSPANITMWSLMKCTSAPDYHSYYGTRIINKEGWYHSHSEQTIQKLPLQ